MKKTLQSIASYIKTHPKVDFIVLGVGLAIFLTITFINAPRASIWFDEAFSAYLIQFNFLEIAQYTANDVHPPFYYWLLKVWSDLFGTTELAYRSLSIVLGAGAVTAAYLLMRKLFSRSIAWVSLLFMVLSPMIIRYSDEARMYTLATLIVFLATHVLLKAIETKKRSTWLWYGVLVSLGMWTHYFTAFAWLAHWAWWGTQRLRKGMSLREARQAFFTRDWVIAYGLAIALYLPWLPSMVHQLLVVQSAGFWIGPVGVDTISNYLTNYFYYLEHNQVQGWFALALIIVVGIALYVTPRAYRALKRSEKKSFLLVTMLAWAPPVLLFFASLPPLRSSFVERYLIPSVLALSLFLAVVLVVGTRRWKMVWRASLVGLVVAMMVFGISNVFTYGNFNKNSNTHILTRQAVQLAKDNSQTGIPIIASSPWVFYEAIPYETEAHPIYFIDENTGYDYGSLDMLKYNDMHKITDLDAFIEENPVFWYLGGTSEPDVAPYDDSWMKIETVSTYDEITESSIYKATLYKVPSAE